MRARKLTRKEKILLNKEGHQPKDFLKLKMLKGKHRFINVNTGEVVTI